MSYDDKCYELALAFLGDYPTLYTDAMADQLAMEIQECVEAFIRKTQEDALIREKRDLLLWCRKSRI